MKLNWGHKIIVVYVIFAAGILYMVVLSSRQKVDLVTADYYGEELKYQERINESGRASALSQPIQYNITQGILTLQFPKEFEGKSVSGEVQVYCPADDKKDIMRNIVAIDNMMKISLPEANKGAHVLKVKWKADGLAYYFEENIFIR
jgi:FixH